jgi:hypothetical protein
VQTGIIRALSALALVGGAALSAQSVSGQPIPGQPIPGQPISGQPISGQPISGQPMAVERFASDELRPYYAHTGFAWKIDRVSNFELNYEAGTEAELRLAQLEQVAQRGRDSILQLLGETNYDATVHVFFVESIERMKQLIGSEVIGRSRPTQHAVFCVVAPFSELSLKHELTHEIATNLWGPAEHWLEEGLANFAVDNKSSLMKRQCLGMMQSKQWIPLNKLVSPGWESSSFSPDDTYPELGGFVEYLYDTYGVARLEQIWKGGSKSIKKVYNGKSLKKLQSEYRSDLLKHRPEVHDAINLPGRSDDQLLP